MKDRIIRYALWVIVSVVIWMTYSHQLWLDEHVFRAMGQMLHDGSGEIYRDLFDHKGPVVYLLYAMYEINPLIECVLFLLAFSVTLECIWLSARLLTRSMAPSAVIVAVTCVYLCTTMFIHRTEMMALPFNFLAFYLMVRALTRDSTLTRLQLVVLGVCLGISSMTRLNNCPTVAAVILYVAIWQWVSQGPRKALAVVGWSALGCAAIWLPIAVYFMYHGTFDDMIYCTVYHNVLYKNRWVVLANKDIFGWIGSMLFRLPIWICIFMSVVLIVLRKRRIGLFGLTLSVVMFIAIGTGTGYFHYYMNLAPAVTLALSACFMLPVKKIISWLGLALLTVILLYFPCKKSFIGGHNIHEGRPEELPQFPRYAQRAVSLIDSVIPEAERDSILFFEPTNHALYAMHELHITPYHRLFYMNWLHMSINEELQGEVDRMLESNPPRWIVTCKPLSKPHFMDVEQYEYQSVAEDSVGKSDVTILRRL